MYAAPPPTVNIKRIWIQYLGIGCLTALTVGLGIAMLAVSDPLPTIAKILLAVIQLITTGLANVVVERIKTIALNRPWISIRRIASYNVVVSVFSLLLMQRIDALTFYIAIVPGVLMFMTIYFMIPHLYRYTKSLKAQALEKS